MRRVRLRPQIRTVVVEIDQFAFIGDDLATVRTRMLTGLEFANRL